MKNQPKEKPNTIGGFMPKSDKQIVKECNKLAKLFYRNMGYHTAVTYKMYNALHPQEKLCWNLAVIAYEHIAKTSVEDALSNIQ